MRFIIFVFSMIFATYANAQSITGAGATFPFPVYSKWTDAYKRQTGIQINYQSIGSGAGIKQILARTVTFGASDMPLTEEILNRNNLFQFPTVIGGNVLVYNLDGVSDLNLTGPVIADIYLGKITRWNDERIRKLNPNVNLPNTNISVVRRSDGSGTTYIFSKYLSSVSEEWRTRVGTGTALEWPVGVGARGNEGVAGNVAQARNSIGYVEYAYAKQNNLKYTTIVINDVVVRAGKSTFQNNSWPITAPTFIIMHRKPTNENDQNIALNFFRWAFENGDTYADELDYVPLQPELKRQILDSWK
jgi:phosphate transport system substrate-binding protein